MSVEIGVGYAFPALWLEMGTGIGDCGENRIFREKPTAHNTGRNGNGNEESEAIHALSGALIALFSNSVFSMTWVIYLIRCWARVELGRLKEMLGG